MHHRSWFMALISACALFAIAPHARADGFYVTFTNPAGASLTPRLAGAVFDATGQIPIDPGSGLPTGQLHVFPVHVEVDNLQVLVPMLTVQANTRTFGATVEFTTPDAQGSEQVYMIAKYTNASVTGWSTKFDPTATSPLKNAVDFSYDTVTYSPPPAPPPAPGVVAKKAVVLRAVTKTAPIIRRLAVPTTAAPPAHVDDAYFQATGIPGESADHPNQIRVTSFSFVVLSPHDPQSGLPTGKLQFKTFRLIKLSGAATVPLQTALSSNRNLSTLSIAFNQHRTGASDSTLASFALTNGNLTSDTLQVANGVSREVLDFHFQHESITSGGASVALDWEAAVN